MKNNLKEILVVCLTAGLFCMSAQSESLDLTAGTEESKEFSWGSCKEPSEETREDCKMKKKSCVKKKGEESTRKSAAQRVLDGS